MTQQQETEQLPEVLPEAQKLETTIKFKDTEFKLVENTLLFKENSRVLSNRWEDFLEENIKHIDQALIEEYQSKVDILDKAVKSINGTSDKATQKRKNDLMKRFEDEQKKFDSDLEVKSIRRRLKRAEDKTQAMIITDVEFIKGVCLKIFEGDTSKLNELKENDFESLQFTTKVIQLFFSRFPWSFLSFLKL